jgi:hypothetical protein
MLPWDVIQMNQQNMKNEELFRNCWVKRSPEERHLVKDFTGAILYSSEVI